MKIKKSDLLNMIQEQNDVIAKLIRQVDCHHKDIIRIEGVIEPEPKLKQLDQSVFDGLDEKWRFAAVDKCGEVWFSTHRTQPSSSGTHLSSEPNADSMQARDYYDASNWQNSLIEREKKELTGSDLARAMLARGDKYVMCKTSGTGEAEAMEAEYPDVIQKYDWEFFYTPYKKRYAVPINNQGEPLTASEVGL